jgi:hypothetical protein
MVELPLNLEGDEPIECLPGTVNEGKRSSVPPDVAVEFGRGIVNRGWFARQPLAESLSLVFPTVHKTEATFSM